MSYQMLPHARPGGIAGLLELILDHNGKDDIYKLADDLAFEIDIYCRLWMRRLCWDS